MKRLCLAIALSAITSPLLPVIPVFVVAAVKAACVMTATLGTTVVVTGYAPDIQKVLDICLMQLRAHGSNALPWIKNFLAQQSSNVASAVSAVLRGLGWPV